MKTLRLQNFTVTDFTLFPDRGLTSKCFPYYFSICYAGLDLKPRCHIEHILTGECGDVRLPYGAVGQNCTISIPAEGDLSAKIGIIHLNQAKSTDDDIPVSLIDLGSFPDINLHSLKLRTRGKRRRRLRDAYATYSFYKNDLWVMIHARSTFIYGIGLKSAEVIFRTEINSPSTKSIASFIPTANPSGFLVSVHDHHTHYHKIMLFCHGGLTRCVVVRPPKDVLLAQFKIVSSGKFVFLITATIDNNNSDSCYYYTITRIPVEVFFAVLSTDTICITDWQNLLACSYPIVKFSVAFSVSLLHVSDSSLILGSANDFPTATWLSCDHFHIYQFPHSAIVADFSAGATAAASGYSNCVRLFVKSKSKFGSDKPKRPYIFNPARSNGYLDLSGLDV